MQRIITAIFILAAVSCRHKDAQLSKEYGEVIALSYYPDTHQMNVGYGISSSGHGVTTISSSGENEKWLVVFKCEHGMVFPIDRKELFSTLHQGDSVVIEYWNIRDSKDRIVDFDFYTAHKK